MRNNIKLKNWHQTPSLKLIIPCFREFSSDILGSLENLRHILVLNSVCQGPCLTSREKLILEEKRKTITKYKWNNLF